MRVLMLSAAYPPGEGGVATHVANLAHGLSHRGVEIVVLTLDRDEQSIAAVPDHHYAQGQSSDQRKLNVKVDGFDRVKILKQARLMVPAYDGRRVFAEEILEFITKKWHRNSPDLIHCHDLDSLYIGWLIKTGFGKPLVFTLHRAPSPWRTKRYQEDPKDLFLEALGRTGLLDAVVVPSETSAQVLRAQCDDFGEGWKTEIRVIFHGIGRQLSSFPLDDQLVGSLGLWQEKDLILCPCRADEHKDVDAFLDAGE